MSAIPDIAIVDVPSSPPRHSSWPCCKRCGKPLREKGWDSFRRCPIAEAWKACDINVHYITGEVVDRILLPGLFHRECAQAALAELEPGVESWAAAAEAFELWSRESRP